MRALGTADLWRLLPLEPFGAQSAVATAGSVTDGACAVRGSNPRSSEVGG